MIEPTAADLGRAVIYTCHPLRDEEGVIHMPAAVKWHRAHGG